MNTDRSRIVKIANWLEEFSWLLERSEIKNIKETIQTLRKDELYEQNDLNNGFTKYIYSNPNKHFLVGVLPSLLQDKTLFKSNQELLDFAEQVLKLSIKRAGKRSRIEHIGFIICEIANLSDVQLEQKVQKLSIIAGDEVKLKKVKSAKNRPNFSWNETIRMLGE